MQKAKMNKIRAEKAAEFRTKRERAFERRAKAEGEIETARDADILLAATGSRSYSLRGRVQHYLLDRIAGVEHDIARIAIDLNADESKVAAALSHIYRRSKYNADALGWSVVRGDGGGPIVHKAVVKAAKPRKAPVVEAPAPEVAQSDEGEAA